MRHVINLEKKVRLTSLSFGFSDMNVEGRNVKEVINNFLNDIELQNWYAEAGESTPFVIYEYKVGKVPVGSHSWNHVKSEKQMDIDALQSALRYAGESEVKIPEFTNIYFNQKVLLKNEEVQELLKRHRGYRNMQRLWKEVEKRKNADIVKVLRNQELRRLEQEKIRKENDIFMLANMMKRHRDFKKMLRSADEMSKTMKDELNLNMKTASTTVSIPQENMVK